MGGELALLAALIQAGGKSFRVGMTIPTMNGGPSVVDETPVSRAYNS